MVRGKLMADSLTRKTLPSDPDAERQVLGAILTNASAMDDVAPILQPEHFYIPKHQTIYRAALDLYTGKDAIDATSVGARVPDQRHTLEELVQGLKSPKNVATHARVVRRMATRREILQVASNMADLAYDKELEEVQAYAKSVVTQVLTSDDERKSLLSPADQVELLKQMIEERRDGIDHGVNFGLSRLDAVTGGMRRGDLVVVGARTSVGKSSFAECVAENVAKSGHVVLFVSVEMDPSQMALRMARRWGISEDALNGNDDVSLTEDLPKFIDQRMDMPLHIWNAPGASTVGIRAHLNQLQAQVGPVDLVIVDYLQLLDDNFGGKLAEHLRLGKITKTLKQIAREYQLPVMLITQLNRNSDQRGVLPEPRLSDIRESGRIEEDADLILFLWREKELDLFNNDTHLKIEKNRQGALGKVPIIFNKPYFTFFEPTGAQIREAESVPKPEPEDHFDEFLEEVAKNGKHQGNGDGPDSETQEEREEQASWV
jgi:replicative DNA helicase